MENSGELPTTGVDEEDAVLVPNPEGAWVDPNKDVYAVPNGVDRGVNPAEPKRLDD